MNGTRTESAERRGRLRSNSHCREELGDRWQSLAEIWRTKQLQYSWLRSLMARHEDFWQITGDALNFTKPSLNFENPALRTRLMDLHLTLDAYPEAPQVLRVRISLFSDTQYLVDLERGHSCPPLRSGQRPSGQECPRSDKSEMRTCYAGCKIRADARPFFPSGRHGC